MDNGQAETNDAKTAELEQELTAARANRDQARQQVEQAAAALQQAQGVHQSWGGIVSYLEERFFRHTNPQPPAETPPPTPIREVVPSAPPSPDAQA